MTMLKPEIVTKTVSSRYMDELCTLKCAPDLLALGIFPNSKEITETFAAYRAAREFLSKDFRLSNKGILLVVVGDGCVPRTAVTFCFRSAWNCISVDPQMRWADSKKVQRLMVVKEKIENVAFEAEQAIIVCVHSHANLEDSVSAVKANRKAVIAIPCCVKQELKQKPDIEYLDWGIFSPHRKVKIWKNAVET